MLAGYIFLSPDLSFPETGLDPNNITSEIQSLATCQKLKDPQAILNDFKEGKSTTRVIVNIRKPSTVNGLGSFSDTEVRKELHEFIWKTQEEIISTLDPWEVKITNRFQYIFGFSAEVTLEGLQQLIDNLDVLFIEKDKLEHVNLAQGIPLMDASMVRLSYSGSGLAIAICDTGIDYTHPRLGGSGFPNSKVIGGYDCADDDADPMDQQGHGTACAGIAAGGLGTTGDYIGGVAYDAKLYAVKVTYGSSGSAYVSDQIEGWEWCITHQYDDPANPIMILSMSISGGRYNSACDSVSPARTTAAANVVAAGITLLFSSGNDGYCDSIGIPACITHAISVGAVYDANIGQNPPAGYVGCIKSGSCTGNPAPPCDEKWYVDETTTADQVCTYSNTATFLDLLAPSNWATTTKLGGGFWDTPNGFGGTSAACPYASGAAACLQCAAKEITGSFLSPSQVRTTLVSTGDPVTDGKVNITNRRINLEAAVSSLLNGGSTLYVDPSGTCGGNTPCYSTIQAAVNTATNGATVKILQGSYNENITLATDKQLALSAGWNTSYTAQLSFSFIVSLTRAAGTLILKRVVIQR